MSLEDARPAGGLRQRQLAGRSGDHVAEIGLHDRRAAVDRHNRSGVARAAVTARVPPYLVTNFENRQRSYGRLRRLALLPLLVDRPRDRDDQHRERDADGDQEQRFQNLFHCFSSSTFGPLQGWAIPNV